MSLFGGLAPTRHFLSDGSATGRLTSGWSLLVPSTSFSTHLCVDLGLTGRPVFSSVLWPRILLPFLPWMLDHPRCLHHPIFLSDGNVLSVITSNHHFCFISRDQMFFPILEEGHALILLAQCCRALLCPCLYQVVQRHTQVQCRLYWGTLVPQFVIHLLWEVGLL